MSRFAFAAFAALLLLPTGSTAGPDLVGCIEPSLVPEGVRFVATIRNEGDEPAGLFYWDAWFHLEGPPVAQLSSWRGEVNGLAPGGEIVRETLWPTTLSGPLQAWLLVDSFLLVSESGFVLEDDETNNLCGPVPYVVSDPDLPNLSVKLFEAFALEDVVTYRVVVHNLGGASAGAFNIDVFHDPETAPTTGVFGDDFLTVPEGLAPGAELALTFDPVALPEGTYCPWVVLDTEDKISEGDETDNAASAECLVVDPAVSLDRPDLIITESSAEIVGDAVLYTIWLKNAGTRATDGPFAVGVQVDAADAPVGGEGVDVFEVTPPLGRGEVRPVYVFWRDLQNGSYRSWAVADLHQDVEEISEKNNVAGPMAVVVDLEGADLVIEDLAWTWTADLALAYDFRVRNAGNVDAPPFDLDLFLDLGERPTTDNLEGVDARTQRDEIGLKPGEERSYRLRWKEPPVGVFQSWVAVDLFRETGDLLMGNNVAGPLEVRVSEDAYQLPDLDVVSFAAQATGGTVTYRVEVANRGANPTGEFKLALFLDRDEPPEAGERGDLELTVHGLAAFDPVGSADEVLWTPAWTVLEGAHLVSWVMADATEKVPEPNELNNRAGPVVVDLVVEGCAAGERVEADCRCGLDLAHPGEFCCPGGIVSTRACIQDEPEWEGAEAEEGGGGGGGCAWTAGSGPVSGDKGLICLAILSFGALSLVARRVRRRPRAPTLTA